MKKLITLIILALLASAPVGAQVWTTYQNFPDNHIFDVGFQSDNTKWFATRFGGVTRYDNNGWFTYDTTNGLANYYLESLMVDDSDNVYVGYGLYNGISKFDGTTWTYIPAPSDAYDMTYDSTGNIWITSFYYGGVSVYDGSGWTTYTTANGFPNDVCYAVAVDSLNNKWFGCSGGLLVKFDGNTFTTYYPPGVPSNSIISEVAIDDSGYVWAGAYGEGLFKFDGTNWTTFSNTAGCIIMGIVFDAPGKLFFGGLNCGVYRYDGVNWTMYSSVDGLGDNIMQNMGISPTGEVWACSKYSGASIMTGTMTDANSITPDPFTIYPNPANQWVNVVSPIGSTIVITDISGRQVMNIHSTFTESKIDISMLSRGMYVINVFAEDRIVSEQLIVE